MTLSLAGLLSSPDVPPVTVAWWAKVAPADFLATAASEPNGTSLTASDGPPYNTNGTPQSERFAPANWAGVRQPIDPAQSFVITPLTQAAPSTRRSRPRWPSTTPSPPACRPSGPPTTSTWPRSSSSTECRWSRPPMTGRSLRDIPRWIPVHRLIWRDWNQQAASGPASQPEHEPAGQK